MYTQNMHVLLVKSSCTVSMLFMSRLCTKLLVIVVNAEPEVDNLQKRISLPLYRVHCSIGTIVVHCNDNVYAMSK